MTSINCLTFTYTLTLNRTEAVGGDITAGAKVVVIQLSNTVMKRKKTIRKRDGFKFTFSTMKQCNQNAVELKLRVFFRCFFFNYF